MASAVASKGAPLAGLLSKLLAPRSGVSTFAYALRPAPGAGTSRLFTSGGSALGRYDDNMSSGSEDDTAVDDRRRRARDSSDATSFSTAGTRRRLSLVSTVPLRPFARGVQTY
jgi:hypothetical protein